MLKPIWEYQDYRNFVADYLKSKGKLSKGASGQLANKLGIHRSLLSQILNGSRNFTLEQADIFCDVFGFSELESELFLTMVNFERAGTHGLRSKLKIKIDSMREGFQHIRSRMERPARRLSNEVQSIFYSHWRYSAIRTLASTGRYRREEIADILGIPFQEFRQTVDFLIAHRLLVEEKNKLKPGDQTTHVSAESPLVHLHHQNWRIRNLGRYKKLESGEVAFTAPYSISKSDQLVFREQVMALIQNLSKTVRETDPEEAYVLCLDLFDLSQRP